MKKEEYISRPVVREFIKWIENKLDGKNSFVHQYIFRKSSVKWRCTSLFSAYENYCWPFTSVDPISGQLVSGNSFDKSMEFLLKLQIGLRESMNTKDASLVCAYCIAVLRWGGVTPKNKDKIIQLDESIIDYFLKVDKELQLDRCSIDQKFDGIMMNSGFTKIYSLLLDDFVIYDSRLGAALGLLVRMFCEESGHAMIPDELFFAFGRGRSNSNRRNPNNQQFKFPELLNNPKRHIINNIKASWLIKEIITSTTSSFNQLDTTIQIRALESALFMIGYHVNDMD